MNKCLKYNIEDYFKKFWFKYKCKIPPDKCFTISTDKKLLINDQLIDYFLMYNKDKKISNSFSSKFIEIYILNKYLFNTTLYIDTERANIKHYRAVIGLYNENYATPNTVIINKFLFNKLFNSKYIVNKTISNI